MNMKMLLVNSSFVSLFFYTLVLLSEQSESSVHIYSVERSVIAHQVMLWSPHVSICLLGRPVPQKPAAS